MPSCPLPFAQTHAPPLAATLTIFRAKLDSPSGSAKEQGIGCQGWCNYLAERLATIAYAGG